MEQNSAAPPPEGGAGKTGTPRRTPWRWVIVGAVALVVVAAIVVGVGSYWWFSEKVETANGRTTPEVKEALEAKPSTTLVPATTPTTGSQGPDTSKAMNIILLGSESTGAGGSGTGRSSTIMVLHVDRGAGFASLLSVPRDLYVEISGHGKGRINTAYLLGGPQLTIQTVKNVLGLDIDRYVEIDFDAFAKSIDSLGGVYVDVDRRYEGSAAHPIDLEPGYRLLSGAEALAFARYRFDKNRDPGRMTRQQRVLAAAREQAGGWDLPVKVPGIVGPILDSTATNLTANEILELAYWLVRLDGDRMSRIVMGGAAQTVDGQTVVVADQATLQDVVTRLTTPPAADQGGSPTTGPGSASTTATTEKGGSTSPTEKGGTAGTSERDMWIAAQRSVPFALQAPRFVPTGFAYAYKVPTVDGTYQIEPGGDSKPAVRMLYRLEKEDLYLGMTATIWTDAPVASSGRQVEKDGTTYTVVGTNGKVDRIWWKKDGVLYFISNTLMYDVSGADLLEMAESMAPVETND